MIERYGAVYPELPEHADRIASALTGEGERFEATLRRATAKLRREIERLPDEDASARILGVDLPRVRLSPWEASAPIKLVIALARAKQS